MNNHASLDKASLVDSLVDEEGGHSGGLIEEDAASYDGNPMRSFQMDELGVRKMPSLVLYAFMITEDAKLEPKSGLVDVSTVERLSAESEDNFHWINVDADGQKRRDLNDMIDGLSLGSFISEQLKRPPEDWMSHVVSTRTKALVVIRILPAMDVNGKFVVHQIEYLAAILKNKALVTFTTSQSSRASSVAVSRASMKYMTHEDILHEGTTSAALISWLEFHVLRTRKAVINLRKRVMLLVKDLDEDPNHVQLKDILDIGDNVNVVLSVAEEQAQCLTMVRNLDADPDSDADSVDFTRLKATISILVATAESTELMGRRLEKRAIGLKETYDSIQQEVLNKRLALLTIVSAIFMPLTFMAGVYGMNFTNMPELNKENGYFYLAGIMALTVVTMGSCFWHYGWFK